MTSHPSIDRLMKDAPTLTDGAWGTELQKRGLPLGTPSDLWNLTHPEEVEAVANAYVAVCTGWPGTGWPGSRILLTNTLGSNRIALERWGRSESVEEINRAAARISLRAAGNQAQVFATLGPAGAADQRERLTREAYREQSAILAEEGVHGFVIETMPTLKEAIIAVEAAVETGLPVVGCVLFGLGDDPFATLDGATPEEAVKTLEDAGAAVIGSNCGNGPEAMLPLCERLRTATRLPLWMKPNAGLPHIAEGKAIYDLSPEAFAGGAMRLVQAGADFIGGCCGAGPKHIRALARSLGELKRAG